MPTKFMKTLHFFFAQSAYTFIQNFFSILVTVLLLLSYKNMSILLVKLIIFDNYCIVSILVKRVGNTVAHAIIREVLDQPCSFWRDIAPKLVSSL